MTLLTEGPDPTTEQRPPAGAARLHLGAVELGDVRPVASTPSPSGERCVELLVGTASWCVHVALRHSEQERLTSCAGDGTVSAPGSDELVGLRRLA